MYVTMSNVAILSAQYDSIGNISVVHTAEFSDAPGVQETVSTGLGASQVTDTEMMRQVREALQAWLSASGDNTIRAWNCSADQIMRESFIAAGLQTIDLVMSDFMKRWPEAERLSWSYKAAEAKLFDDANPSSLGSTLKSQIPMLLALVEYDETALESETMTKLAAMVQAIQAKQTGFVLAVSGVEIVKNRFKEAVANAENREELIAAAAVLETEILAIRETL